MKVASFVILVTALSSSLFGAPRTHVVQKGETLYSIAREYDMDVATLRKANPDIKDVRSLQIGTTLTIPSVHTVQKSETFWSISHQYGMTVSELLSLNGYTLDHVLMPGEQLLVLEGGNNDSAPVVASDSSKDGEQPPEVKPVPSTTPVNPVAQQPAQQETKTPFWPLAGKLLPAKGKLSGTYIIGKKGEPIYAVEGGTVLWSDYSQLWGNFVIIEAANNLRYLYGATDNVRVHPGDKVEAGAQIANLGLNPQTGDPRLFFSVVTKTGNLVNTENAPRG